MIRSPDSDSGGRINLALRGINDNFLETRTKLNRFFLKIFTKLMREYRADFTRYWSILGSAGEKRFRDRIKSKKTSVKTLYG